MQLNDQFFNNITITFKNWRALYSSKHIYSLLFDLEYRTFQLATAAIKEVWYIVMHLTVSTITDLPFLKRERQKHFKKSFQSSALQLYYTYFLARYIKQVFLISELFREGVEPLQTLNSSHIQNITFNKQTVFQNRFMEEWDSFVQEYLYNNF